MGCLLPGPLPLFAGLDEVSLMRVPDIALKCVVFVGKMDNPPFVPFGTAFLVSREASGLLFPYLVTCRHVLDKINSDDIYVRSNRISGAAEMQKIKRSSWIGHPNPGRKLVDLAVCQITYQPEIDDLVSIPLDEKNLLTEAAIAEEDIGIGDDVYTVGLFTRHAETKRNVPIVRGGIISVMAGEPIWDGSKFMDGYLLESRSIGGLSGSPVFVHLPPFRSRREDGKGYRTTRSKRAQYLMGMIQGHFEIQNSEDLIKIDDEMGEKTNAGIASVVPIQKIIETIDQPHFADARPVEVERKRRKNGYVPD
jgi:hypothetical protein